MSEQSELSPLEYYRAGCEAGELVYQYSAADDRAVFYPRVMAPGSGDARLVWRKSKGKGTVYATTTVHRRNVPPYNVALIDVDEGFRMMSRVEGIAPEDVRIGMRVRVRMRSAEGETPAYPVFVPDDTAR